MIRVDPELCKRMRWFECKRRGMQHEKTYNLQAGVVLLQCAPLTPFPHPYRRNHYSFVGRRNRSRCLGEKLDRPTHSNLSLHEYYWISQSHRTRTYVCDPRTIKCMLPSS